MPPVEPKFLAGRTALITGSGRNLGRGIALGFARAGANIVLNGHRDRAALDHVAAEIAALGAAAQVVLADVSKPADVRRLVEGAVARFGAVDIAVSNVGIRPRQPFLEISAADWARVLDTNLGAAFHLAQAVLPGMKARGWGRIIHMSGHDGFMPIAQRAHNVVAKAGLHALAKAIAVEFGEFGITANTIAPFIMDTTRDEKDYPNYRARFEAAKDSIPLRRLGTLDDVADACLYLARAESYVNGQVIHLNGGQVMY